MYCIQTFHFTLLKHQNKTKQGIIIYIYQIKYLFIYLVVVFFPKNFLVIIHGCPFILVIPFALYMGFILRRAEVWSLRL